MRIAFLDCFSGAAGDMWVGALLDLGLPLAELEAQVAGLRLPGVTLRADRVQRGSLQGTRFQVLLPERSSHAHRNLADIRAILARADLTPRVRERCEQVFLTIAEAEAKVHGSTVDAVHFHEVGAEDTIVDIVCAVLGTELLGIERYYASAVVTGSGTVRCEHGILPVPAPGALGILQRVPLRNTRLKGERTTPTGAALLKVLVHEFEPSLTWIPEKSGYGAGTRDTPDIPNLLRITLGELRDPGSALELVEISCNLDTASGELLAYLIDGCIARGAADAFAAPITMKKGRPAHLLTALCDDSMREPVTRFLLEESGSLGLRMHRVQRSVLERWEETLATELGEVRMKCARLPSGQIVRRPEEDDLLRIAREHGLSRAEVARRLA